MSTATRTLLILALANLVAGLIFATGLVHLNDLSALYVTLPAGAIFSGLFLLFRMLEKETAYYNQEQKRILSQISKASASRDSVDVSHPIGQVAHRHAH